MTIKERFKTLFCIFIFSAAVLNHSLSPQKMGDFKVELGGVFLHNNTYDYSDYTYEDEVVSVSSVGVCITLLYSIVLAVGLPAHALVLFLALKKQCWTKSDIFILHLSIADILLLVTLPLWAAQAALPKGWGFGLFLCRITGVFFNVSTKLEQKCSLLVFLGCLPLFLVFFSDCISGVIALLSYSCIT